MIFLSYLVGERFTAGGLYKIGMVPGNLRILPYSPREDRHKNDGGVFLVTDLKYESAVQHLLELVDAIVVVLAAGRNPDDFVVRRHNLLSVVVILTTMKMYPSHHGSLQ